MDVSTDEHRMLLDSLDAILSTAREPQDLWQELAQLGVLGVTLPEGAGGAGLGLPELLLLVRRLGSAAIDVPYLTSEGLAVPLLAELADRPAVADLLPSILDGTAVTALSVGGANAVTANRRPDGYLLNGRLPAVPGWTEATIHLLAAELEGQPAIFILPKGTASADATLADATLPESALLAHGAAASRLLAAAAARGRLLTCAAMVGAMEALLDLSVEYLRTRRQFGQPLASFQVLQHAAVDMYVELETARAMLDYGARMLEAPETERSLALDAVKLKVNRAARFVGETAVQLHGAIGMTMETLTGRLFARLTAAQMSHGDSRHCLNRLVAAGTSPALS